MDILDCRLQIAESYDLLTLSLAEDKELTKDAKSYLAIQVNLKSAIRNVHDSTTRADCRMRERFCKLPLRIAQSRFLSRIAKTSIAPNSS